MTSPALVSLLVLNSGSGISERIRLLVQGDLYTWQGLQPTSGPNSAFFQFCDALEVKDGVSAPASGWGLEYALSAWGNHFKTVTLPRSKLMTFLRRWRLLIEPPRCFGY